MATIGVASSLTKRLQLGGVLHVGGRFLPHFGRGTPFLFVLLCCGSAALGGALHSRVVCRVAQDGAQATAGAQPLGVRTPWLGRTQTVGHGYASGVALVLRPAGIRRDSCDISPIYAKMIGRYLGPTHRFSPNKVVFQTTSC